MRSDSEGVHPLGFPGAVFAVDLGDGGTLDPSSEELVESLAGRPKSDLRAFRGLAMNMWGRRIFRVRAHRDDIASERGKK